MAYETITKIIEDPGSIIYYQIDCLKNHPELPVLPIYLAMRDNHFFMEIDISNKMTCHEYLKTHTFSREEWILLILFTVEALQCSIDYFLDPCCFTISLSTLFFTIDHDKPVPTDNRLLYLPLVIPTPKDPLQIFCDEILDYNTSHFTKNMLEVDNLENPAVFSAKDCEVISNLSVDRLSNGLLELKNLLDLKSSSKPVSKSGNFRYKIPEFMKNITNILQSAFACVSVFQTNTIFILSGFLLFESVLIFIAFQILRYQDLFTNSMTPILLISTILAVCGVMDLFLIYSKKSPLFCLKHEQESNKSQYILDKNSLFHHKEEKTVLMEQVSEARRIAMLCSGVPGTLDESKGLKAYILVDDFLIGRDGSKVDFKINYLSIGRIHARIMRKENSFFIEDLDSRNGTWLDQKKLKKNQEYLLPEKCKIRFAEQEFNFMAN